MTNKIKSLIYLSCFIFASVVYNSATESNDKKEIVVKSTQQEADVVLNTFTDNNE